VRRLSVAFVVPFGERSEGFFPDALLAMLCARTRARGHRAALVRAYYDGHDAAADARIAARLEAWLDEAGADLVVVERLFDPGPVRAHLAKQPGRVAVLVSRGDSFDPVDGVSYVVGGNPGVTRTGATRRTPSIGALELAFGRLVDAWAGGADPADVAGVASVVDGELVLARPLERPAARAPFEAVVEHDVICDGPVPEVTRKTLFGNVGCPYAADPLATPHFAGVSLPQAVPVARLGCSFCALGGDYEKRPDAEVVRELVEQAAFWASRVPGLREFVLNDQHAMRYLAELMTEASRAGVRPMSWLFAARADTFVREAARVRRAVEAAEAAGQRVEVYLTGFEAFSDVELARYNKGVSVADQLAGVRAMRALARERPISFGYANARGHSLILWNPWTRPEDVTESVGHVRRAGLSELFHELGRNRLRLYRDLPLFYAAERDGALAEAWDDGDEGAARRKGYSVEHPWRFLDPRTRVAYALAGRLRERLGLETEVAQLHAAAAFASEFAAKAAGGVDEVLAGLDALRATLARLAGPRGPRDPAFGRGRPASSVLLANGCNNGCAGCPNRDRWLDDAALFDRLDAALRDPRPVVFAGREPTLHPRLIEAVARCRRPVGVVTNGRRFSSIPYTAALRRAGLAAASVKLFGPDEATADAYSRDPGGFAQALAGLANLRDAGVFAEARLVLHRGWFGAVDRAEGLLARLPFRQVRLELPLDAIGLESLRAATDAVERLSSLAARQGVALDVTPLETGQRLFDWLPGG
jgi:hypothetical protein